MTKIAPLILAGLVFGIATTLAQRPLVTPPAPPRAAASEVRPPARGIVVSCPGFGREWGSADMWATLDEIRAHGANAVQIHPYAGIGNDGEVRNRRFLDPADPPLWITRPIEEARRRGLRFMMKPHLAYWGSRFSWRGEIEFGDDEAAWRRFFASYERWIVNLAKMSAGAETFVVGTELDRTLHREAEWRRVIAAVRKVYSGRLTYAANWTDHERVPFWDALDCIGVQAYFPLVPAPRPGEAAPTPDRERIRQGWAKTLRRLEDFARRREQTIVFTELGYNRSAKAATEPWDHARGEARWAPLQARCLEAALEAVESSPLVEGAYLWKWFPGRAQPRDFNVAAPHMRAVLDRVWLARARREAEARPAAAPAGSATTPRSPEKGS